MDEVGCTTPFGINLDHICIDVNDSKKAKKSFDLLNDLNSEISDCPYPCKFMKSSLVPYTSRYDHNFTVLRFDKFIKATKAEYSYTELELLAEFGGYVGLFLGISVFHISLAVDKILQKLVPPRYLMEGYRFRLE